MRPTGSMRAQIGTLVIATSVVQLANGFFGTFISLRVMNEDFGATMAGLVLSSYFAGFTLGALRCGGIIDRIGHIRAYAAFGGLVVAATAAMPVWVAHSHGCCCAGSSGSAVLDLRHYRELAQRQGPIVRTRTGFLGLDGRHLPGPGGWTAHDRPRSD